MSQSPSNGISIGLLVFAQGCRTLPEIWVGFLYEAYILRKWFWIDFNGKMETRHHVEGWFGSEFQVICNHCVVMAAWVRKTWKFCEKFLRFFGKTTLYGKKFQNSVSKVFTASPIDVLGFNCPEIRPTGNRRNRRYLPNKKNKKIRLPFKLWLLREWRPKSARASPNYVLRLFQISSKSVHF